MGPAEAPAHVGRGQVDSLTEIGLDPEVELPVGQPAPARPLHEVGRQRQSFRLRGIVRDVPPLPGRRLQIGAVPGHEALVHPSQCVPQPVLERDDEPEVDQTDPAIGQEQDVARMEVRIEQPSHGEQPVPGAGDPPARLVGLFLRRVGAQELLQVHPLDVVHGQHPSGAQLRIRSGDDDVVPVLKQLPGELPGRRLPPVVLLGLQPETQVLELVLQECPILLQPARGEEEHPVPEVLGDRVGDAGILDLDRHDPSRAHGGPVHPRIVRVVRKCGRDRP